MSDLPKEVLKVIVDRAGKILIEGYIDSSEKVSNLLVNFLPRDGYSFLLHDSLELLVKNEIEKPDWISTDTWYTAFDSVRESLKGSYNRAMDVRQVEEASASWVKHPNGYFIPVGGEPNQIVLIGMFKQSQEVIQEGRPSKRSDRVQAAEYIKSHLPIGGYIHRINLYPGKFFKVSVA